MDASDRPDRRQSDGRARVARPGAGGELLLDPAPLVDLCVPVRLRGRARSVGGHVRPEVATSFPTVRRSGRNWTYTIRVRSGFRYQDGTPVTAADFVHAIHRDLNPAVATIGPSVLHDLVSAKSRGARLRSRRIGPRPIFRRCSRHRSSARSRPVSPQHRRRHRRWPAPTTSRRTRRARSSSSATRTTAGGVPATPRRSTGCSRSRAIDRSAGRARSARITGSSRQPRPARSPHSTGSTRSQFFVAPATRPSAFP